MSEIARPTCSRLEVWGAERAARCAVACLHAMCRIGNRCRSTCCQCSQVAKTEVQGLLAGLQIRPADVPTSFWHYTPAMQGQLPCRQVRELASVQS